MIENITSSEYLHKSEFRMCCGQREVIQTIYRFKTVLWANTWDMLKTFFWRHWTKIYLWGILYTPYYINTPQKRFHIEKYPTDWNISIYIYIYDISTYHLGFRISAIFITSKMLFKWTDHMQLHTQWIQLININIRLWHSC